MRAVLPALVVTLLSLIGVGCSPADSIEQLAGPAQGSTYHIKYVRQTNTPSSAQVSIAVQDVLDTIDRQVSTYRTDSDLAQFNQLAGNSCLKVQPETMRMLAYAQQLNAQSQGIYDISLLPILQAWGFAPKQQPPLTAPNEQQLLAAKANTGMQHLTVKQGQICKDQVALQLDLNSLAAGFTVDTIAQRFEQMGIHSYMIEVTGEIFAKGTKPDGSAWHIALEQPSLDGQQIVQQVLNLDNLGIATSGDYRNYYEKDGVRYSHIVDVRTAKPITHNTAAVTVIASDTMQADALATLLLSMGAEQGLAFAEQQQIAALFISREQQTFSNQSSSAFKRLVAQGASL